MREALESAITAISSAGSLAITCHINPDGDALGSALALAHSARLAGVDAVVSFGGEFAVPDSLVFLDLTPLVPVDAFPQEPECLVVFDVAAPDRLGEIGAIAANAATVVVIDHHNPGTLSRGGVCANLTTVHHVLLSRASPRMAHPGAGLVPRGHPNGTSSVIPRCYGRVSDVLRLCNVF